MEATYEIIPIIRNTVDTSGGELGMVVILRLMEKYSCSLPSDWVPNRALAAKDSGQWQKANDNWQLARGGQRNKGGPSNRCTVQ